MRTTTKHVLLHDLYVLILYQTYKTLFVFQERVYTSLITKRLCIPALLINFNYQKLQEHSRIFSIWWLTIKSVINSGVKKEDNIFWLSAIDLVGFHIRFSYTVLYELLEMLDIKRVLKNPYLFQKFALAHSFPDQLLFNNLCICCIRVCNFFL